MSLNKNLLLNKNKKKVLIISNYYWTIFNFRKSLIIELQSKGYHVVSIAKYDGYESNIKKIGCETNDLFIDLNNKNIFKDLFTFVNLYIKIKEINPNISIIYTIKPNIYASMACRFIGIKYVNIITGLGTIFINQTYSFEIIKIMYKYSLSKSSSVIFQNNSDKNLFKKIGILPKKYKIINGSGVDVDKFKKINHVKIKNKNRGFTFIFIGRLLIEKGVNEFLEAAIKFNNKYTETKFLIVGSYNSNNPSSIDKGTLNKIIKKRGFNYLGFKKNVEKLISVSDCLVLPSYREGLSRSILEAMALSKPVITTNTPGCKDLIKNGVNGYLAKPKSSEDLMRCMEKMYCLSKIERNKMGSISRKLVIEKYSNKVINTQILNLINKLT